MMDVPNKKVVTVEEYQQARADLLEKEKAATRLLQELAATRRQLPMVQVPSPTRFKFDTPEGERSLSDLFGDRKQLILYHFMLAPHEAQGCVGCSFCMDHIPDLRHLQSRNTSFAAVATAPLSEITAYANRMEWKFPFYSSAKTHETWAEAEKGGETISWKPGNGYFGLCSFLKEGDEVFHTYDTTDRGLEIILSTYHLLDMTPMGRQEVGNGMNNFRRHFEY
ncbi:hypothetical protein N7462_006187 [Penicillium macrosclerotiorum]|uniref:uncharacterized protein n=1 Tax=Penicillium macrosclerotiorum TaxID=303699 RepID=UPI00254905F2|nr:uncharacterized protein N7462_006187 [Penicillium macrosclerotiorum]KAJ5683022.1 hypothetical protein N7462_006187 [Penicillium macrosclerotiorum]